MKVSLGVAAEGDALTHREIQRQRQEVRDKVAEARRRR